MVQAVQVLQAWQDHQDCQSYASRYPPCKGPAKQDDQDDKTTKMTCNLAPPLSEQNYQDSGHFARHQDYQDDKAN